MWLSPITPWCRMFTCFGLHTRGLFATNNSRLSVFCIWSKFPIPPTKTKLCLSFESLRVLSQFHVNNATVPGSSPYNFKLLKFMKRTIRICHEIHCWSFPFAALANLLNYTPFQSSISSDIIETSCIHKFCWVPISGEAKPLQHYLKKIYTPMRIDVDLGSCIFSWNVRVCRWYLKHLVSHV